LKWLWLMMLFLGLALVEMAGLLACCNLMGWASVETSFLLWMLLPGIGLMFVSMFYLPRLLPPPQETPS
jgi:hypothetical protein